MDERELDELLAAVTDNAKYRAIDPDLIRAVGRRELAARRNFKEAVKATRNKLHQVAGAYLDGRPDYASWVRRLNEAQAEGEAALRAACLDVMRGHASTRERLPILDRFFATTLAGLPPVESVLDVACGLGPLARAWMPLAPGARYYACDLYADMMAFLGEFFALAGIPGEAFVCDLVARPPEQEVDLALVLKVLPPLEQIDKAAGLRLLRGLRARHLLVSFPAQTLGGRHKAMAAFYEQHFRSLIAGEGWSVERFIFPSELAFLVRK
ncbi:MAG TPA: 16S rRNA methyltransferase [Roseiflexaceae bacterium]|nr:16S rRNA methyltransferase [Roseiflexaceae bacterium]